jgi:hypothetical protein
LPGRRLESGYSESPRSAHGFCSIDSGASGAKDDRPLPNPARIPAAITKPAALLIIIVAPRPHSARWPEGTRLDFDELAGTVDQWTSPPIKWKELSSGATRRDRTGYLLITNLTLTL